MTIEDAERAWRHGRTVGLALLWSWPVVVAAAWLLAGTWTLLVTVPVGPWVVLGAMYAVELAAGTLAARSSRAVVAPVPAAEPTAAAA